MTQLTIWLANNKLYNFLFKKISDKKNNRYIFTARKVRIKRSENLEICKMAQNLICYINMNKITNIYSKMIEKLTRFVPT